MIFIRNRCAYSIVVFISLIAGLTKASKPEDAELKLVNVIFRHGDRTPENNHWENYPNDPYRDWDYYPNGRGQLINVGKMREYNLGRFLRSKYRKFLGQYYIPNLVKSLSSDYDRTKASLQLVLAGLFPPRDIQDWHPELNWQPIPARYIPRINDNLFLSDECPSYLKEYARVSLLPEIKEEFSKFDDTNAFLTNATGKVIGDPLTMAYLYHIIRAQVANNLTLPEWTKEVFPRGALYDGILFYYKVSGYSKLERKLFGGGVLRRFVDNIIAQVNDTLGNETKLFLYSGHETNIAALLSTLDVFEPHTPEYASAVVMELLQGKDVHYVKVFYYRGIPPVTEVLRLPGCDVLCPLNQFLRLVVDVIPSDEDLDCDKTLTSEYDSPDPNRNAELYDMIKSYIENKV